MFKRNKQRAVFRSTALIILLLLSVIAPAGFIGSAAAVQSSLHVDNEAEAGDTVTVELQASATDRPLSAIITNIDEAGFQSAEVVDVSSNTESVSSNLIILGEQDVEVEEVTVTYEVKIPDDADPGETFTIEGTVGDTASEVYSFGPETITVSEESADVSFDVESEGTADEAITAELNAQSGTEPISSVITNLPDAGFESVAVVDSSHSTATLGGPGTIIFDDGPHNEVTVTFEAVIPEDAEKGDSLTIEGSVGDSADNLYPFGPERVTVIEDGVDRYIDDETGTVTDVGLVSAINDWQSGDLDSTDLVAVINEWL